MLGPHFPKHESSSLACAAMHCLHISFCVAISVSLHKVTPLGQGLVCLTLFLHPVLPDTQKILSEVFAK